MANGARVKERTRVLEANLLPVFRGYFNDPDLQHMTFLFEEFDYASPTRSIELKERTVLKDTYKDTMIGCNKIEKAAADTSGREYVFAFLFKDGLYYWVFDHTVQLSRREGGRWDRGFSEKKDYYFIPTDLLTQIPHTV